MLFVLFLCSAVCALAGAVMIGFGIPVKEFSFGNTLISSGVIAVVGGLILFGLALAIAQLQRIMEALSTRPPIRAGRGVEPFDQHAAVGARGRRMPFPSRQQSDARASEIPPAESALQPADMAETRKEPLQDVAPTLRNPDEPPMVAEDINAPLSPQENLSGPVAEVAAAVAGGHAKVTPDAPASVTSPDADIARDYSTNWRPETPPERQPQTTFFDAMWPADQRLPKYTPREELPPAASVSTKHAEPAGSGTERAAPDPAPRPQGAEVRTVAILKSGVVDGMGYTLYVDGSIEAELPDGKLRFASINELRSYLEKNS